MNKLSMNLKKYMKMKAINHNYYRFKTKNKYFSHPNNKMIF